jgi:hypothetical protein
VSRARDWQRAEDRLTARTVVTAALRTALPTLSDDDVSAVLAIAKADKGIPLNELAAHLATHPDALTSGDPRCPRVVVRLAHALLAAGHTAVVRPGCAGCGKVRDLPRSSSAGRLCQMCAVRANLATCARCGREDTRIAARRAEGGICFSCYRRDPDVVEQCGRCGRRRMPVTRLDDGTPLCLRCWTPPVHRCDLCGRDAPASINRPGEVVCQDCYRLHRNRTADVVTAAGSGPLRNARPATRPTSAVPATSARRWSARSAAGPGPAAATVPTALGTATAASPARSTSAAPAAGLGPSRRAGPAGRSAKPVTPRSSTLRPHAPTAANCEFRLPAT